MNNIQNTNNISINFYLIIIVIMQNLTDGEKLKYMNRAERT